MKTECLFAKEDWPWHGQKFLQEVTLIIKAPSRQAHAPINNARAGKCYKYTTLLNWHGYECNVLQTSAVKQGILNIKGYFLS